MKNDQLQKDNTNNITEEQIGKAKIGSGQDVDNEKNVINLKAQGTEIPDLLTGRPFTIRCY